MEIELHESLQPAQILGLVTPGRVAETVREHGVAILPNFFSGSQLRNLTREFQWLMGKPPVLGRGLWGEEDIHDGDRYRAVILNRKFLPSSHVPVTTMVFGSDFMNAVTRHYYGPDIHVQLNGQLWATEAHGTLGNIKDNAVFRVHFDGNNFFKFFVYLTDTTEANGAFHVVPGSLEANREFRREKIAQGSLSVEESCMGDQEKRAVPIEAPAGTLIVFDSDIGHKAGTFTSDKKRLVIRGHTKAHNPLDILGAAQP